MCQCNFFKNYLLTLAEDPLKSCLGWVRIKVEMKIFPCIIPPQPFSREGREFLRTRFISPCKKG